MARLARVYVPPHKKVLKGKTVTVDGYWQERKGGSSSPGGSGKSSSPGGGGSKKAAPAKSASPEVKAGRRELRAQRERARQNEVDAEMKAADKESTDAKKLPDVDTDEGHAARVAEVQRRLDAALEQGMATENAHAKEMGGELVWDPDRAAVHKEIVDKIYEETFANVPADGKVAFSGGLGGAGKGTVLSGRAGVDTPFDASEYGTVDPDQIKEEMAERGMIPEVEGLSPMERVVLIHEESSSIAWALAMRAAEDKKNILWDITMSSEGSVRKRIDHANAAGYTDFSAIFVDIPVETSVERALSRHRNGQKRFQSGEGMGGRFVPPNVIQGQRDPGTGTSRNRAVFDSLREMFSAWALVDNSGSNARVLERSESGATEKLEEAVAASRGGSSLEKVLRLTRRSR